MKSFKAKLEIIGINPFVFVPHDILNSIFDHAGNCKGNIPIKGIVNGEAYKQTLIKYRGEWRLYINTTMLPKSPQRIGETIKIAVKFDSESREIQSPTKFLNALNANKKAKAVFDDISPSRKLEIVKYLTNLKTEAAFEKNIKRAINFLLGKERFIGRDKP